MGDPRIRDVEEEGMHPSKEESVRDECEEAKPRDGWQMRAARAEESSCARGPIAREAVDDSAGEKGPHDEPGAGDARDGREQRHVVEEV